MLSNKLITFKLHLSLTFHPLRARERAVTRRSPRQYERQGDSRGPAPRQDRSSLLDRATTATRRPPRRLRTPRAPRAARRAAAARRSPRRFSTALRPDTSRSPPGRRCHEARQAGRRRSKGAPTAPPGQREQDAKEWARPCHNERMGVGREIRAREGQGMEDDTLDLPARHRAPTTCPSSCTACMPNHEHASVAPIKRPW
jgi:hypothetical protein